MKKCTYRFPVGKDTFRDSVQSEKAIFVKKCTFRERAHFVKVNFTSRTRYFSTEVLSSNIHKSFDIFTI